MYEPPAQIEVVAEPVVVKGSTVTVTSLVDVYPSQPSTTQETAYDVVVVGETIIGRILTSPFDQRYVPEQPLAVKVAELPAHIVEPLPILGAAGIGLTVTIAPDDGRLVQPFDVQVTVYVVVVVGDTVIEFPVVPVDQVYNPEQPLAVKVAELPLQIVAPPPAFGAVGSGVIVRFNVAVLQPVTTATPV